MDNNNGFKYSYSPMRKHEIEAIRKKYLPREESKLERLKALDRRVSAPAQAAAIALGVLGGLILGLGMSCILAFGGIWFFVGIPLGLLGIGAVSAAYPVYNKIFADRKARYSSEILALSEELMNE